MVRLVVSLALLLLFGLSLSEGSGTDRGFQAGVAISCTSDPLNPIYPPPPPPPPRHLA